MYRRSHEVVTRRRVKRFQADSTPANCVTSSTDQVPTTIADNELEEDEDDRMASPPTGTASNIASTTSSAVPNIRQGSSSGGIDFESMIEEAITSSEGLGTNGDTIYLSARRKPRTSSHSISTTNATRDDDEDQEPIVTISTTPPPHLIGLVEGGGPGLTRRTSVKKTTPSSENGNDLPTSIPDELDDVNPPSSPLLSPPNSTDRHERYCSASPLFSHRCLFRFNRRATGIGTGRTSFMPRKKRVPITPIEIIVIVTTTDNLVYFLSHSSHSSHFPASHRCGKYWRHVLAFLRLPYTSSRSKRNTLIGAPSTTVEIEKVEPNIDPNDGSDELIASLEKSTSPTSSTSLGVTPQSTNPQSITTATKYSFFFSRKSTPSSAAIPTPLSSRAPSPLPPSTTSSHKSSHSTSAPPRLTPKTLVLDLDETLIHSTSRPYANSRRSTAGLKVRVVEVVLDGRSTIYTVYKRPWVDYFLRKVSSWYTVIIFTASLPEYADPVIDWLDGGDGGGGMVGGRLFRSDCLHSNGAYVKDLSVVDADLSRVCLVDNSPVSYAINQANGIPIEGWINDPHDECLLDLLPMLDSLRFTNDVRRVLGLRGFGR